jgi:hypothetical protein
MAVSEAPHWRIDPQSYVERWWGKPIPLPIKDIQCDLFDSTGRPVWEVDDPNPADVPFTHKTYKLPDSRKGLDTNDSAYQALKAEYSRSMGILALLRARILGNRPGRPTREDLSQVVNAGMMLPFWYVLKSDNPTKNGEIPPYIAGVTKMCRGLALPIQNAEVTEVQDRYAATTTAMDTSFMEDPTAFYRFVDGNEMLITKDKTGKKVGACPVPAGVIIRGARVLFGQDTRGIEEAEALLGLTQEDIIRIKKLGTAFRININEQKGYGELVVERTPIQMSLYKSLGITSPLDLKDDTGRWIRKQQTLFVKNMNHAQRLTNEALKRRQAPSIDPTEFAGPSFKIKDTTVFKLP